MVGDIDLKEKTVEKTMEVARTAGGNLKIAKDKLASAIDQHITTPAKEVAHNIADKREKEQELKREADVSREDADQQIATKDAKSKAESVIEFKNVSKIYPGNIVAVDKVSLSIKPGEFISLVGPSGAGKSTLIRLLTGEEFSTSGQVLVSGRDISKLLKKEIPYYRRKVGVIFQDFKLLPKKTVYENVAFALEVADMKTSEILEKVPQIIEIVGLTKRSKALSEELSGGEKQRVSIARAIIHKPKLLIADEPTGNLDPVATWEIIELLFKINNQGTIVLLATHDKEVVDSLERRVITMKNGKVVSDQAKGKYIL
jgi:cell division transport system ATP-binding protein